MPVQFHRFSSEKQAADAVFNELRRYLVDGPGYQLPEDDETVGTRRATAPFVLMLAGGQTPLPIYRRLAREVPSQVHPAVHLLLSDDRYVPFEDERSNAGSISPTVRALGLPDERFIRVETEYPVDDATGRFSGSIRDLGTRNAIFALALLGIGGDGHTASLFSAVSINDAADRLPKSRTAVRPETGPGAPDPVAAARQTASRGESVPRGEPGNVPDTTLPPGPGDGVLLGADTAPAAINAGRHGGTERISATPEVLLSFRRLIFFATGSSKREILYDLSRRPEDYPAGALMLRHPNAEIWTDEAPRVR